MIVNYSKSFEKTVDKLSGKMLESIKDVIKEVKKAVCLSEIKNCKKIKGFSNVYRIRTGYYKIKVNRLVVNATIAFRKLLTDKRFVFFLRYF